MRNSKTTILGVITIILAICTAVEAALDDDPTTMADLSVVLAEVLLGIGMIWVREEKQHEIDNSLTFGDMPRHEADYRKVNKGVNKWTRGCVFALVLGLSCTQLACVPPSQNMRRSIMRGTGDVTGTAILEADTESFPPEIVSFYALQVLSFVESGVLDSIHSAAEFRSQVAEMTDDAAAFKSRLLCIVVGATSEENKALVVAFLGGIITACNEYDELVDNGIVVVVE